MPPNLGSCLAANRMNEEKNWQTLLQLNLNMGVSKNVGTPKWMVYNGKPY